MNKTEMIRKISEKANNVDGINYMNAKQIAAVVDAYNEFIVDAMREQETVRIATGFSLKGVPVEAHERYCALTGETMDIPSHIIPKLRVTKAFKEEMNGITW